MLDITRLIDSSSDHTMDATSVQGLGDSAGIFEPPKHQLAVTWRVTRFCNLSCRHCPSDSQNPQSKGAELGTEEGKALIGDLGALGNSRLIFAGGEPLLRADLRELVAYAHERKVQTELLTNGTLLTLGNATELRRAGLDSVSILLEGLGREVDQHRGAPGAYNAVMEAYANCKAAGLNAELRVLMTRWNFHEMSEIFKLVESQRIRKVTFAHVVSGGLGFNLDDDTRHAEKRLALDLIIARAQAFKGRGVKIAIATDDNHADGIFLYLRMLRTEPELARAIYPSILASSAALHGSGTGIAGIDSNGDVYPDAYWVHHVLGNVRETPFSEIWKNSADPLLQGLRDRLPLLKGKCAKCRYKAACGGSSRLRANDYFGDPWMADPACYLTNDEIDKDSADDAEAMEDDVLLPEQAA